MIVSDCSFIMAFKCVLEPIAKYRYYSLLRVARNTCANVINYYVYTFMRRANTENGKILIQFNRKYVKPLQGHYDI